MSYYYGNYYGGLGYGLGGFSGLGYGYGSLYGLGGSGGYGYGYFRPSFYRGYYSSGFY
ncbi:keratin-associated protein 19-9b-like [Ictidomys tridecemlineatus]|uniref:Keratin-associated protein 19-9b-like n=1 Tax=Ictidomys tridecemlineatus TaxID=43179 RepID=I3MZS7_ICTTR|nr:keratin-associated protein 19-9b-like [Ictidomys tridecemlineatus]KAG3283829.1 keratin-associated protein 19-9b-like [Ictidomys tridecemlineatus]